MKFVGGLLLLLALSVALSVGQAPPRDPKITDLFTADEFRKAGLSKLRKLGTDGTFPRSRPQK